MAVRIIGNNGNIANVTEDNELMTSLTQDISKVGSVAIVAEVHDGSVGASRIVRPIDVSADYRTRVGADTMVYYDNFCHAQVNASKYKVVTTTLTSVIGNGYWELNGATNTAAGHVVVQTFGCFPLYLSYSLYFEIEAGMTFPAATNNVCEWGIAYGATTAAPTDGVVFRKNPGGNFLGVISFAGSETSTILDFVPSPGEFYHYLIVIHNDETQFWIDDICYGVIETPHANGSPIRSMSCPILFRNYNTGVSDFGNKLMISNLLVSNGDMFQNKDFSHIMACNGNHAMFQPDGIAAGYTANYANSAAPANASLANITAGYTTLGGQFQFAAVGGAETDFALFAFLNPAGTNTIPGKDLVISGINISTFNMGAAVATTPHLLQWGIGVGSTAVSLATTDSLTTGARGPRRKVLGVQYLPIGAVIGQKALDDLIIDFNPPITVEQGSYFHVILKVVVGTATSPQIIRGTVDVNGHFE